jgi:HAE1 family hydrophobic/amphiphilic exporter-1
LQLVPRKERKETPGEVIELLKIALENVPGAFVHFSQQTGDEGGGRELDVEIKGDDIEVLTSLAREMAGKIQEMPGIGGVVLRFREGRPELKVKIDHRKAALAGLYAQDVAQALRSYLHGPIATKYVERNEEVDLRLRLRPEDRRLLSDLDKIQLPSPYGYRVSLREVSTFEPTRSTTRIWRKNGIRMVAITARLKEELDLGSAGVRIKEALKGVRLPKDYSYDLGRNYEQLAENQRELLFAVALTVVLMYMILAALFESFIQPFIIILSIPLAFIGVAWALFLTGSSVNLAVYIGAIMLAGIVVNNAIVLIDRINQLRAKGIGEIRAIISASRSRLRPITMTTLTTVLGLLPMAFDRSEGANLWGPLAITVVAGLSTSTLLTLLVVPTAYFMVARKPRSKRVAENG